MRKTEVCKVLKWVAPGCCFPVYHGQTNIVTPLALIVKQKRKWWKRPFGKAEMIILGGLESYIVDEKKNHFLQQDKGCRRAGKIQHVLKATKFRHTKMATKLSEI